MAINMKEDEAISWLYSYSKYGSKLGLERITTLLDLLENPHHSIQTIHVTGTNGKGSVCRFLGSILSQAGFKTGVYLSPHLERFSERMVIDGVEISDNDFGKLINIIKPIVKTLEEKGDIPTFFEIVTAIAFLYFKKAKVDYAVIEVGLGGRFDATNVIQPLASVITNISLEHTQYLGDDVTSVAYEKAGIIKSNTPVITAAFHEALQVIEAIAKEKQSSITKITPEIWERTSSSLDRQEFYIKGTLKEYQLQTSILGEFQGENLAVTIHTIEQLQLMGIFITENDIQKGIASSENPGRMEIISSNPLLFLDGAHNPAGMKMLTESMKKDFQYARLFVVIGILKDKNIVEMLKSICSIATEIIFTKSENPRACEPERLKNLARKSGFTGESTITATISDAVTTALNSAQKTDIICVTGSLFTVGEARTYLLKNKNLLSKKIRQ
jgi:dihydrofolate synthase/folylpolyglutamate synthase